MFFVKNKEKLAKAAFKGKIITDINPLGGTIKKRRVFVPNKAMREIQKDFLQFLRSLKIKLPYATGVMPGCNPLKNVKRHARNRFFYLLDIKHFYPSIRSDVMCDVMCNNIRSRLAPYKEEFQAFLNNFCFTKGGLVTGSPTSPDLANILGGKLFDEQCAKLAKQYGLTYTRYLDDLTFSSPWDPIGEKKRKKIRSVILEAGFEISHRKSQLHDLRISPIVITGVGLEYGGRTFLPRHFVRKTQRMIQLALIGEEEPAKIYGMMGAFYASVPKDWKPNMTELRLLKKYKEFRHVMKGLET